jgi:hypothetical protein
MTPGGEIMLRIRDQCVLSMHTQRVWNTARARTLARLIAWHRRSRGLAGEPMLRRTILEDIITDIGWPRFGWLKRNVREAAADIEDNLADASKGSR